MPTNRLVANQELAVYAETLFNAAMDFGGEESVLEAHDQLSEIRRLLYADASLTIALSDPEYTPKQRHDIVKGVFAGCNLALCEVLAVMAERGDVTRIPRLFHAYVDVIDEKLNLSIVEVTTVVALNDELRTLIKEKAAKDLGKRVVLREHIDPSIMAGIIMSTGGKRIDASVKTQLDHARYVLKETPDGGESS